MTGQDRTRTSSREKKSCYIDLSFKNVPFAQPCLVIFYAFYIKNSKSTFDLESSMQNRVDVKGDGRATRSERSIEPKHQKAKISASASDETTSPASPHHFLPNRFSTDPEKSSFSLPPLFWHGGERGGRGDPNRPVSEYSVGGGGNLNRLPPPLPASLNNNNESTQMALYSDGRGMEAESDKNGAGGKCIGSWVRLDGCAISVFLSVRVDTVHAGVDYSFYIAKPLLD